VGNIMSAANLRFAVRVRVDRHKVKVWSTYSTALESEEVTARLRSWGWDAWSVDLDSERARRSVASRDKGDYCGYLSARMVGDRYGYPECCIRAFAAHEGDFFARPKVVQQASRGGFLPCPKHARQIVEGELTIGELLGREPYL
jgi:hypothetical protein